MNKRFKSLAICLFSLPFFISPLYSEVQTQTVQTYSPPRLEEKVKGISLEESHKPNSLIPLINQRMNAEEIPDFYIRVNKKELNFNLFQNYKGKDILLLQTPVALGRKGWSTPSGNFYLRRIINFPIWYPPAWANTKKIPKPGRNNPYGLWMSELSTKDEKGNHDFSISGDSWIRIHSTDEPSSIGRYASHGCIRLLPKVAEELFPALLYSTPHREGKKNARGIIYPLEKAIPISIK